MYPKQMCYQVAGRSEGGWSTGHVALILWIVILYVSFSLYSDYLSVNNRAIFQRAVQGGDASVIIDLTS